MATQKAETIRRAVILAGGRGTRVHPFSAALPKPLIPIGDTPILDIILGQLEASGVRRVTIAAGHMAAVLTAYISAKSPTGMKVDFSIENEPLGTAGPLALISDLDEPFFVLNGDLLTSLNYKELSSVHRERKADITVCAHKTKYRIELGVLLANSMGKLLSYLEKPEYDYLASMGVYAMEPSVLSLMGRGERIDLPQFVGRAMESQRRVFVHEFSGYWRDIGTQEEYERAQEEFRNGDPLGENP